MSMYCGGHGHALLCWQCAENLRDAPARRLYNRWTDNQGIHCNRFPGWDELSSRERDEWRLTARAEASAESANATSNNPTPDATKEGAAS